MNRRGVGAIFCLIAAILFSTRYISAAIIGSVWQADLFSYVLDYTGNTLTVCSIASLCVGVGYLVWAEIKDNKLRK